MNIKYLKLNTGENVVCEMIEEAAEFVRIKDGIIAVPNGEGLAFVPLATLCDPKNTPVIEISYSNIQFITEPAPEIKKHYESYFSKIITPPEKKVII